MLRLADFKRHWKVVMNNSVTFKKPTIKATSRAYVRLFGYFSTPEKWLAFIDRYRIEFVEFGMHRNGDCSVRVIDSTNEKIATLGLDVPNEIKYHTYTPTGRSFWTENLFSPTHRRHRVIEIGLLQASKDEVIPL
jgi:hypothetical protein